jgi:hypothetical protein
MGEGFFDNSSYSFMDNKPVQPAVVVDDASTSTFRDGLSENIEQNVTDDLYEKIEPETDKTDNVAKIIDMMQNRFRIRRNPHSIDRLRNVLKEDRFKDFYNEGMFDQILRGLESSNRSFNHNERSKSKRNNRSRKRGR